MTSLEQLSETTLKPLQPPKALAPILVTLAGMAILVSGDPKKAASAILVQRDPAANITLANCVPQKAPLSMDVTLAGIMIFVIVLISNNPKDILVNWDPVSK